ncbi:TlpA disulfide reductase family protein [Pseudopedobacter sp.]|uniref:TlpA disulfide reductase family protein n=1 Tax=Pseudopedobacter sp. TaxID=1936787 RepID=UPI0033426D95
MRLKNALLLLTLAFLIHACDKPSYNLPAGIWRGVVLTQADIEIPFNFEVNDTLGKYSITILNGKERLRVDDVSVVEDSVFIKLPFFDAELKGSLMDGRIEGVYLKHLPNKDIAMEFYAQHDVAWRIKEQLEKSKFNIDGRWETYFIKENGDSVKAIGEFKQEGNKVTGTFLTRTGDYRFLDGVVDGDELKLSTFDGGFAMYFTAKILNDSTMADGRHYSGFSSKRSFVAKRNEKVQLDDAYRLTYLKPGYDRIEFSFPDLNGNPVSLKDKRFKDKVVVVQILGSWCPNCIDETAFLSDFYNKQKGEVEIVGLAYERTKDFEKSKASLKGMLDRFGVKYPILITGYTADDGEPSKSLPMLNHIMAFPTTIILDKKGKVRKIHTGFSGPGSGRYYEEYVLEFENIINTLQKEQ